MISGWITPFSLMEFARSFSFSSLKVFRGWSLLGLMSLMSIYKTLSSSASMLAEVTCVWEVSPFESFIFLSSNWTACSLEILSSLVLFELLPFSPPLSALVLCILLLLDLFFVAKRSLLLSPVTSSMMSSSFVSIFSSSFCSKSSSNRGAASAKSASSPLPRPPFLLAIFLLSPLFSI